MFPHKASAWVAYYGLTPVKGKMTVELVSQTQKWIKHLINKNNTSPTEKKTLRQGQFPPNKRHVRNVQFICISKWHKHQS